MPTKHPRHAITETPQIRKILDQLRRESGKARLDWAELVVLGAREKLRQIEGDRKTSKDLRKAAADQIRKGIGDSDVAAADEVKRSGWISS